MSNVEPPVDAVVDDNEQVQTALMEALSADQNAIAVAEQSRQRIAAANAEVADAEQKLRDANAAAEESWESLFNQMRDRVERSPVKGGVLGAKILPMLLLVVGSLVLFTGCARATTSEFKTLLAVQENLETRVRNTELSLDSFSRQATAVDDLRKAINANAAQQLDAIDRQTAAITKTLDNTALAERVATIETSAAAFEDLAMQYRENVDGRLDGLDQHCNGLGSELEARMGDRFAAVSKRIDALEQQAPRFPCGVPGQVPRCPCQIPGPDDGQPLILPQPVEETPPAKKPARACPKRKPRD